jgi:hypothetical protein
MLIRYEAPEILMLAAATVFVVVSVVYLFWSEERSSFFPDSPEGAVPNLDNVTVAMVARFNVGHYRKLLGEETDETTRQTLLKLVAEEEAKLIELVGADLIYKWRRAGERGASAGICVGAPTVGSYKKACFLWPFHRTAGDAFERAGHSKRHGDVHGVAASRRFVQLGRDVLPYRFLAGMGRQMAEQRSHIG